MSPEMYSLQWPRHTAAIINKITDVSKNVSSMLNLL